MSREYCKHCAYPKSTCVCAAVERYIPTFRIIILQHEKESKHAKNTARLAKLVSPTIEIVKLSDVATLTTVAQSLTKSEVVVLYPNDTSIALESYMLARHIDVNGIRESTERIALILIDSSWRQAHGIWQHQTWLKAFIHCHFSAFTNKQYVIRKSKRLHQLSTIEAVARSIEIISGESGQVYLNALNRLKEHWLKHIRA